MTGAADRLVRQIEELDAAAAHNQQRTESYQRMTEDLAAIEGKATSADGVVTAIAGPGGSIRKVTFTAKVREADVEALSTVVTHTVAQAQANVARAQAEVVRDALGDTEMLDRALYSDQLLFGDQPSLDSTSPGVAERQPQEASEPRSDRDDEVGEFSVFQNRRTW